MRRAPSLRQIEVFWAVIQAGSISSAARALNVAQPGLSRMLRHMEDGLGFALFERVRGRLIPTLEGEALFREAGKVHQGVAQFGHTAERLGRAEESLLRIGAGASVANWPVPAALSRVATALPGLRIRLDTLGSVDIADSLLEDRCDATVALAPMQHPSLESKHVGDVALVCAMPPGHPLAVHPHVTVQDANAHPMIVFDKGTAIDLALRRALAPVGGAPGIVAAEVRFAVAAVALVEAGLGIALVDECTVAGAQSGRVERRVLTPLITMPVHIVTLRNSGRSVALRRFTAEISRMLARAREDTTG